MERQKELEWEFANEAKKTRRMLKAIPDDADLAWKPNPKSMALGRLAAHVGEMTGEWGMCVLAADKADYPADHDWGKNYPKMKAELLEKFERELKESTAALAAVSAEAWEQNWQFIFGGVTYIDAPRWKIYRELLMNHLVHHRAQLGVYIRLVGGKVPGCFGPSADES
jgi:uncharacterized damage-inducible protein DinB